MDSLQKASVKNAAKRIKENPKVRVWEPGEQEPRWQIILRGGRSGRKKLDEVTVTDKAMFLGKTNS